MPLRGVRKSKNKPLASFLDEELYPALYDCLDTSFPEFAWRKQGRAWVATRWPPDFPFDVEHRHPDRLVVYENSPGWIMIHGHSGLSWTQYLSGGATPKGEAFWAVVKQLAARASVTLPVRNLNPEEVEQQRVRDERRRCLALAIEMGQHLLLHTTEDHRAFDYVFDRGFNDDDMQQLGFGYYRSVEDFEAMFRGEGCDLKVAQRAGLVWPKLEGYMLVPWMDAVGRPLTIYGRWSEKVPPADRPKTIALPGEGTKSSPLYFDRARGVGHQHIIAVEGVFDAALLQARGDNRVVAYVAAQFSHGQVSTLSKHGVQAVTIVPDPDGGGDRGAIASVEMLERAGIRSYVAPRLPNGLDPDEFLLREGIDGWQAHVTRATPGPVHKAIIMLQSGISDSSEAQRRLCLEKVADYAASLQGKWAEEDRRQIAEHAAAAIGFDAATVNSFFGTDSTQRPTPVCDPADVGVEQQPLDLGELEVPDGYRIAEDGVYRRARDEDGEEIWLRIVPRPVWPADRMIDGEGRVLFKLRHSRGETTAPRDALVTAKKMKELLAARDLPVSDGTAGPLVRYFESFEAANLERFSNAKITTRLGWHQGEFVFPGIDARVRFQALGPGDEAIVSALQERGSLEGWLEGMKLIEPSWRAKTILWGSVSGPWLRILRQPSFVIHVYSDSSGGKTTSQMYAASAWGNPAEGPDGLLQTWNTTVVALEQRAHLFCDLPLFLSELQTVRNEKDVSTGLYMLSEERGRARGRREGGTKSELTWKVLPISTGEVALSSMAGTKGASMRVVEVFGLPLEHLNGEEVRRLRNIAQDNYGIVGRLLLQRLAEGPTLVAGYAARFAEWQERLAKQMVGRFGDRLAQHLAVIAVGASFLHGEVLADGTTDDDIATTLTAVMHSEGHEKEQSYAEKAHNLIQSWVTERISSFTGEDRNRTLGKFDKDGNLVILPTALQQACRDLDLDLNRVIRDFAEKSWLAHEPDRLTKKVRVAGPAEWGYVITSIKYIRSDPAILTEPQVESHYRPN